MSLRTVGLREEIISSGAIQRIEPARFDVVEALPDSSSRIRESPKSARHACPASLIKTFACEIIFRKNLQNDYTERTPFKSPWTIGGS